MLAAWWVDRLMRFPVAIVVMLAGAILGMFPTAADASSAAGIEIQFGKFRLSVYYSVAVDYEGDTDRAIRDPRAALFDLAALLQANSAAFSVIDHEVHVSLDRQTEGSPNLLDIIEDPNRRAGHVLRDGQVGEDIGKEIVAALCRRYAHACRRPAAESIDLFPCRERRCPGRIRFGSFPSDELNERFGLLPPRQKTTPIRVTRGEILTYFEELP